MPAFAQSAGGMLTDKQVDVIVRGIREHWSQPDIFHGATRRRTLPRRPAIPRAARKSTPHIALPATAPGPRRAKGQFDRGRIVSCLVSDQELRTIVIAGRPELGAPDWRSDVPGKPMSAQDISDVVAWLASQRPKFPGQPFPTTANRREKFDDSPGELPGAIFS
jgi:cytochrome c oxidase cbb3-type subunit 3